MKTQVSQKAPFVLLLFMTSCTGANIVDDQLPPLVDARPTSVDQDADVSASDAQAEVDDDVAPTPLPPAETSRLDLLGVSDYAEYLYNFGTFCDLGTSNGHTCTRGGFRTRWGGISSVDEQTVAEVRRRRFQVHLPVLTPNDAVLRLRIRPQSATSLQLDVGGRRVDSVELTQNDWNVVQFDLDAELLDIGENVFTLSLRGGGARGRRAAVDWVWLGEGTSEAITPQPPVNIDGETAQMVMPRGSGFALTLPIPPHSRVAITVAGGENPSRFVVRGWRDGQDRPIELINRALEARTRSELSADLTPLSGDILRLELFALEGGLTLESAEILQRDEENELPSPTSEPDAGATEGGSIATDGTTPASATNLVIVLIDTLRADHLTTYNPSTRVRSEAFTRFAETGVVFDAAQAQENWTKPSVATLLTSLYPSSHNTQTGEAVLPNSVETFAEILQDRGFATAAFIANGYVSRRFGFHQGWDRHRNYVRERRRNRADAVVDDAIAWLDERPRDQPFFLYVHTIDPHVPYCAPRPFREIYDPNPYHGPIVAHRTAQLLGEIKVGNMETSPRDRERLEALYDGEITYHDEHLGRFIAALEERGLLNDTLIWLTSDHGEEFFDHGSVGHGHSLFQELLHVPLVAVIPGNERAGTRVGEDVGLIDVLPTSLELLGLAPHAEAEGASLVPLIDGAADPLLSPVFSEFLNSGRAVRLGRYKLLLQGDDISLFDLEEDPREQNDISTERPLLARGLLTLLALYLGNAESPRNERRRGPRRVHQRQETEIDAETLEQLRALGYMLDEGPDR